jgi:enterobactin synthetase component D / holo-[acyl-carrier protein] synthase
MPLHAAEEVLAAGRSDARRGDFIAGRGCARALLGRMGLADEPVTDGPAGEPRWPAGVAGSIAHCRGLCAVAVARSPAVIGLGLDVEVAATVDDEVLAQVCRPDELRALESGRRPPEAAAVVFSAKEAFYKLYFSVTERFAWFDDVYVEVDWARQSFVASLVSDTLPRLPSRRNADRRCHVSSRRSADGRGHVDDWHHADERHHAAGRPNTDGWRDADDWRNTGGPPSVNGRGGVNGRFCLWDRFVACGITLRAS